MTSSMAPRVRFDGHSRCPGLPELGIMGFTGFTSSDSDRSNDMHGAQTPRGRAGVMANGGVGT